MKTLRWMVACAAMVGAQESHAPERVGDLRFQMPPGWNRVEKQNVTALIPPGVPPGKTVYLALFPAVDLKAGLREWFDGEWASMMKEYRLLEGGQAMPQNENGLESIAATAAVADRAGTRWAMVFGGVRNGARVQPMLFMDSAFEQYQEHLKGLQVFLSTLRLNSSGPNSPNPPAVSDPPATSEPPAGRDSGAIVNGRLYGIYRSNSDFLAVANKTGSQGAQFQTFYPDGRYVGKMPDQGMDNDDSMDMRLSPLFWGTYTLTGSEATVVFPISMPYRTKVDVSHFTICQGGYMINSHGCNVDPILSAFRLESGDGVALQGTFRRPDYNAQNGPKQGIAFTADGRFADEGIAIAAPVVHRDARGNYKFDDGRPGRGTYHVGHYTLTLSYSDGRVRRETFYLQPGASKTDVREFFISTFRFIRVN